MYLAFIQKLKLLNTFLLVLMICCFATTKSYAQTEHKVSDVVTGASSEKTIPGVNILVKGTTTGAATDAEEAYSLSAPSANDTLVVSRPRQISSNCVRPSGRNNELNM
jgi:hypothetical protein